MLGVAATGVVWVLEVAVGIPFGLPAILGTAAALISCASLIGYGKGHRLPPCRLERPRVPRLSLVGGVFAAATIVYLEGAFRAARLAGLYEFDAWAFWCQRQRRSTTSEGSTSSSSAS